MLTKKTWVLNETTGNSHGHVTFIDEEENDLDFCVRFYKKIGYKSMNCKYSDFDELLYRVLDHNHTEFLGLILK